MSIIATIGRHARPAHTHRSNARIRQDYGNSACLLMWEFGDADYRNYDHHSCHDDYYRPSAITRTVASVAVVAAAVAAATSKSLKENIFVPLGPVETGPFWFARNRREISVLGAEATRKKS